MYLFILDTKDERLTSPWIVSLQIQRATWDRIHAFLNMGVPGKGVLMLLYEIVTVKPGLQCEPQSLKL